MPAPLVAARAIPWRLVIEAGTIIYNRFRDDVPPKDRRRLGTLVRKSKGDPRRLTAAERRELLEIVKSVDVQRLGRDIAGVVGTRKLLKRARR